MTALPVQPATGSRKSPVPGRSWRVNYLRKILQDELARGGRRGLGGHA